VQSAFTELGVIAVREDVNLEPAFWAQFPGNFRDIARRALISSGNFAGMASLHNFPVGQPTGNHWGPAITVLETTSAGPYYFNFHQGDLGNFTVIGPSGSGKTVVLGFLLAQAQKVNPRTSTSTRTGARRSSCAPSAAATTCSGPDSRPALNPLLLADEPINRRFLNDWTVKLIAGQGGTLDAEDLARVAEASTPTTPSPPSTVACATSPSCSAAGAAPPPQTSPAGSRPGTRTATTPGCSTTRWTRWISRHAPSAST
jgi:type IV secretion system protein VirB4